MQTEPIGVGRAAPELLETVAELRWKGGKDITVTVKDAGNGPAVDVREYVTRDAYKASDFRVVGGSSRKPRRQREPYVGPTKRGFWISPELALEVGEALVAAALRALELGGGDDER